MAGVLAAKKTWDLIPYCHPLPLTHVSVKYSFEREGVRIQTLVKTHAVTGVEMEALTAASIATLTLYDMLKPHTYELDITSTRLISKTGGKSGDFHEDDVHLTSFESATSPKLQTNFKRQGVRKSIKILYNLHISNCYCVTLYKGNFFLCARLWGWRVAALLYGRTIDRCVVMIRGAKVTVTEIRTLLRVVLVLGSLALSLVVVLPAVRKANRHRVCRSFAWGHIFPNRRKA